jgi:hypothetical protein
MGFASASASAVQAVSVLRYENTGRRRDRFTRKSRQPRGKRLGLGSSVRLEPRLHHAWGSFNSGKEM